MGSIHGAWQEPQLGPMDATGTSAVEQVLGNPHHESNLQRDCRWQCQWICEFVQIVEGDFLMGDLGPEESEYAFVSLSQAPFAANRSENNFEKTLEIWLATMTA